jgi:hypothetical protein
MMNCRNLRNVFMMERVVVVRLNMMMLNVVQDYDGLNDFLDRGFMVGLCWNWIYVNHCCVMGLSRCDSFLW